jgi:hypothetical protein
MEEAAKVEEERIKKCLNTLKQAQEARLKRNETPSNDADSVYVYEQPTAVNVNSCRL